MGKRKAKGVGGEKKNREGVYEYFLGH